MNQITKDQVLYEDDQIIVCEKRAGFPVQSKRVGQLDMENALRTYFAANSNTRQIPYVGIIQRLDQPVEGILVFAKTPEAAKNLSAQIAQGKMEKRYRAIVVGRGNELKGKLEDYLLKDGRNNTSQVVAKGTNGAKRAVLYYEVLSTRIPNQNDKIHMDNLFLVDIKLETGRHHQIRVQMSHAGMPLWGDTKYNPGYQTEDGWQQIALCAYKLEFSHPKTKKKMKFEIEPKGEMFQKVQA